MLTEYEFHSRINFLLQNVQDIIRKQFQNDIDLLNQNQVSNYEQLLGTIVDVSLPIELRTAACWLISKIGDEDSLPKLMLAMGDKSPLVRRQAIQALGELKFASSYIVELMEQALNSDSNVEVRTASAYSLGLLADQESLAQLIRTLIDTNEDPIVRGMAAEALINFRNSSTIPSLIASLSDEASEVCFWAAFALGQLSAKEALPELKRLAETDHTEGSDWYKVSQEATDAIRIINEATSACDFD